MLYIFGDAVDSLAVTVFYPEIFHCINGGSLYGHLPSQAIILLALCHPPAG